MGFGLTKGGSQGLPGAGQRTGADIWSFFMEEEHGGAEDELW